MTSRPHGMTRYKEGPDENGAPGEPCRCGTCRAANATWHRDRRRLIAYGRWEPRTDAAGTRRRLAALIWNGWSMGQLGHRAGLAANEIRRILLRSPQVTPATAEKIRALYSMLWDQPPPEETRYEKMAATKARAYARDHGFAPPAAWDDDEIDDPAAAPAAGWERSEGTRPYGVADEAAWLLSSGEEPQRVAERLGVSHASLWTVLARAARKQEGENRVAA